MKSWTDMLLEMFAYSSNNCEFHGPELNLQFVNFDIYLNKLIKVENQTFYAMEHSHLHMK